jgi:hypothetical protein
MSDIHLNSLGRKDSVEKTITDKDGRFHFNGTYEYIFEYFMRGALRSPDAIISIDSPEYKEKSYHVDISDLRGDIIIYL